MIEMQGFTLFATKFTNNADSAVNLNDMITNPNWLNELTLPSTQADDAFDFEEMMFAALDSGTFFKVTGSSMKDAGIFDGDIAIVEKDKKANVGDIVIAMVDGKYTIRFLEADEEGKYYLRPANKKYKPIRSDNLKVFGVVISVFRNLKR